jgi:hypothetical protein
MVREAIETLLMVLEIIVSWQLVFGLLGWLTISLLEILEGLCSGRNGRVRALKRLLLSVMILAAPTLALSGGTLGGYLHGPLRGRMVLGLMFGVPLWAITRIVPGVVREFATLGSRIRRRHWLGEPSWGLALLRSGLYLLAAGGSVIWFKIARDILAIDPSHAR